MSRFTLVLCMVVLVYATLVSGQFDSTIQSPGWWMMQPYGDMSFNEIVVYNHNITLDCNDTNLPDDYTFQYWIRPDLKVMISGDKEEFWTLDGTAGWQVNDTTYQIHIFTVQENQFGFYHCILTHDTDGSVYVVKKAINYEEPYYGNGWDRYGKATVIGCIAAGSFLVLAFMLLLISRYRYKGHDDNYSLGGSSVKDYDPQDPQEGGSSSNSGSVSDHPIKAPIPVDGPQVFVNATFEGENIPVDVPAKEHAVTEQEHPMQDTSF